jgi:hypothetical protein
LRRQKVSDLSSAIAATNGLVDFDAVDYKGDARAFEISSKFKDKDEMINKKKFFWGGPKQAPDNERSKKKV